MSYISDAVSLLSSHEFCPWPLRGSFVQSELTCFTKRSRSTELTGDEIASAFIKVYDFPQAMRTKCHSSVNDTEADHGGGGGVQRQGNYNIALLPKKITNCVT